MARTGSRNVNRYPGAAQSRQLPEVPAAHATAAKQYVAVVNVPAADDATNPQVTVDYLTPPAAHATNDITYLLRCVVTGDDTTGGSTAVIDWVVDTGYSS